MKIAIMLCLLALSAQSAFASYDDYQRFRKGTYSFEFETQYFKSDANYVGDSYQSLPFNQSYEIFDFYLKARLEATKRLALYGNLDIANATSTGVTTNRTNSSVTGATLGAAYLVYNDNFDVITDLNVLMPLNKIDPNTDSALNSEGVIQVTGLLRLQKDLVGADMFGYIGATYRQDRSALMPWGVGLEGNYPRWGWGGKIFGYESITDDPDSSDINKLQRTLVTDRVDAGSLKFYSVNPNLVVSEAYLRFKIKNTWVFTAGGGATLTGSNTAAGYHAGINVTYLWDTEPSLYYRPVQPPANSTNEDDLSSERKVPKFKEEIDDGVDQKLFQKKAPPAKPGGSIAPADDAVAMKKVGPQPTPVPEAADGGEVQLKLKKKKKKKIEG